MTDEPIATTIARDREAWLRTCPWHPPVSRNAVTLALALAWSGASGRTAYAIARAHFRSAFYETTLDAARELEAAGLTVYTIYTVPRTNTYSSYGGSRRKIILEP